jgi:hypothetical protein
VHISASGKGDVQFSSDLLASKKVGAISAGSFFYPMSNGELPHNHEGLEAHRWNAANELFPGRPRGDDDDVFLLNKALHTTLVCALESGSWWGAGRDDVVRPVARPRARAPLPTLACHGKRRGVRARCLEGAAPDHDRETAVVEGSKVRTGGDHVKASHEIDQQEASHRSRETLSRALAGPDAEWDPPFATSALCDAASWCMPADGAAGELDGICHVEGGCDLVAQDCAPDWYGQACVPVDVDTSVCVASGPRAEGQTCSWTDPAAACQEGLFCSWLTSICYRLCDPSGPPSCLGPKSCQQQVAGLGEPWFGLCL